MKYLSLILLAALTLQACGPKEQSPESIRQAITRYKSEITDLNNKIRELEAQLEKDSLSDNGVSYMAPVRIDTMTVAPFRHFFEVGGSVEAVHEAFISPEINGRIDKIYVKEGQRVATGTLLARLNTDITESSIQEVETNLELARIMFKKQKELWDQNIGSEVQFLQSKSNVESLEARLKTMKAQLAMASIRAPFAGIVDEIFRKEGELAVPGIQLMRLVNLGEVIVKADIAETYINEVKAGDKVSVEFPSYGNDRMDVSVSRTGNVISMNNRSFPIEIRMKNPGGKLKPNSMAVIHVNDYSNEKALIVPSIIIKQDVNKGFFLFVTDTDDDGNPVASKRYVKPGKAYDGKTEILSGLEPGETVIIDGYNTVANGTRIEIL